MADKLPKFIVIQAPLVGATYAYYRYESDNGPGYVSCRAESVFEPLAKVEVEAAKIDSKFVHLRFCHTNKYWARRGPGQNDHWIFATSDQPEEDKSKLSCTLFEPTISDDGILLYLTHVQSGGTLREDPSTPDLGIYADDNVSTRHGFNFVDWDTLVKMPKRVTFKGDNGKFLKAYTNKYGYPHLKFSSTDGNDEFVPQEVFWYPDGRVRIKSDYFGKFWRCNVQNWILANSTTDESGKDVDTLFWPIKVDGSTIALRASVNKNEFCKRLSIEESTAECLNASAATINQYAKLVVEELVLERNIYSVRYRMEDARVYDERPFVAGTGTAANDSDTESSLSIRVEYEDKRSYTYSSGFSLSTGVTTTIEAGIPLIASAEIAISVEMTSQFAWEQTTEETKTAEATYTVKVPPRSRVTVDYVATSGKCSVPFSYTQKDKSAIDGQFVTSQHTDGIFHGVNYYSFRFEQHAVEPLKVIVR